MSTKPAIDVLVIDDPDVLRLVARPLRLRILEHLRLQGGRPVAVKELASALDVPQTTLYYHVNLLAKHRLIQVVDERLVSGIVERRYQVTAFRLSVDRSLLGGESEAGLEVWLSLVLDEAKADIRRAVKAGLIDLDQSADYRFGPRRLVLGRKWLRLSPSRVDELNRRFDDLLEELATGTWEEGRAQEEDSALYEFLIGFYPAVEPEFSVVNRDQLPNDGGPDR